MLVWHMSAKTTASMEFKNSGMNSFVQVFFIFRPKILYTQQRFKIITVMKKITTNITCGDPLRSKAMKDITRLQNLSTPAYSLNVPV